MVDGSTLYHGQDRLLAVIVVAYNSDDVLGGLLDSLADGLDGLSRTDIVVADNASVDGSVATVLSHPIGARVVPTGWNGGYAAGINAALATVDPKADVLILNPDIRLSRGAARYLLAALQKPGVGIAVPRILHENGELVHSLRREPSILTAWADAVLGAKLGWACDVGESIRAPKMYQVPGTVDWASGAVLAISANARRQIGSWDESYFLYSEETDYQRQARACGLSIQYVPQAQVVHIGGDYQQRPRLYEILTANRIRYFERYHGLAASAVFRAGVLAGEMVRVIGNPVHKAGVRAALSSWAPHREIAHRNVKSPS